MKMKTQQFKIFGTQQKQFSEEVYSNTGLPQEARKTSNKEPNLTLKGVKKRTTNET